VVRRFVSERSGITLARSSCRNYLHRLGFEVKRPRKRLLNSLSRTCAGIAKLAFDDEDGGQMDQRETCVDASDGGHVRRAGCSCALYPALLVCSLARSIRVAFSWQIDVNDRVGPLGRSTSSLATLTPCRRLAAIRAAWKRRDRCRSARGGHRRAYSASAQVLASLVFPSCADIPPQGGRTAMAYKTPQNVPAACFSTNVHTGPVCARANA
jgi:hypothetical protein